jgi:nucleoside-diphosphate-sugar epimerase
MKKLFITGATGFLGNALIKQLSQNPKYEIYGLVRKGSEGKLPPNVKEIVANPFDAQSYKNQVPQDCIYLHLIGVHRPAPWRIKAFKEIDLGSVLESIKSAQSADCQHFIYVSVAMESSVMFTYQANKKRAEAALNSSGMNVSLLRPWYVVGEGRTWVKIFNGLYNLAEKYPNLLAKVRKFRLVSHQQILDTLIHAIESEPKNLTVYEIDDILEK